METPDTKKLKFVNTECSPSYLFNNLSETNDKIYYIHNSEIQPRVIVIDKKLFSNEDNLKKLPEFITKLNGSETLQYSCIKKVEVNDKQLIAVGLLGGFKIWSSDGSKLLFQATNSNLINNKTYSVFSITERNSISLNNNTYKFNSVVFGDSHGLITQCKLNETFSAVPLYRHKKDLTVTALTSNLESGVLVSGYDNGQIIILDGENEKTITELCILDNEYNLPVVSLASINSQFISSYLNGELRIFSYLTLQIQIIFQAHLKSINSLSVYSNYLISSGDDSIVNVFKLENEKFELVKNIAIPDKTPVGAIITNIENKPTLISCHFDNPVLAVLDKVI